jgi:hypothetical protein
VFQLLIHKDAEADLEQLATINLAAASRIVALIQEIQGNQDLLDCLTKHDFGQNYSAAFHVSKWQEHWRRGKDIWRLKIWDLEDKGIHYRIIYAYIIGTQRYYILAVAPRNFNYDADNPLTKRILRAYDDL